MYACLCAYAYMCVCVSMCVCVCCVCVYACVWVRVLCVRNVGVLFVCLLCFIGLPAAVLRFRIGPDCPFSPRHGQRPFSPRCCQSPFSPRHGLVFPL